MVAFIFVRVMEQKMKGRGAGFNPANRFLKQEMVTEHVEGLDEPLLQDEKTVFHSEYPKVIVNEVNSPDLGFEFSMNPYQGCEHGCIYCYARNSHTYWGWSAGLDFEREIHFKPEAPSLFRKFLSRKNYVCKPIVISGNTDCYQPGEAKFRITRQLLEVALEFGQPVSMITKNALILRDLDLLGKLAERKLVQVMISITTLDESIRRKMEPRTVSALKRLEVVRQLSEVGIRTGVMVAPIIPGLTSDEIPRILEAAGQNGASGAGMTIVRLNGQVSDIFHEWLKREYPDRQEKVWNLIRECHAGKVNDSRFGDRMKGTGEVALAIQKLFSISKKKYITCLQGYDVTTELFKVPGKVTQLNLF